MNVLLKLKTDYDIDLLKRSELLCKELENTNLTTKDEEEIILFIAYLCNADISPPPPIPSVWYASRGRMRRTIYASLIEYANTKLFDKDTKYDCESYTKLIRKNPIKI